MTGAGAGVAQHADRFHDPVAAFGDRGRLAGQHAAGGGLGVAGVVLAEVALSDSSCSGDFDDLDALELQRARQAGTVAAGALNPGAPDRSALLRPADQCSQAAARRRERLAGNEPAEQVDQHRGVRIAVGVDAEDDFGGQAWHGGQQRLLLLRLDGVAQPSAGTADKTLMVLGKAPIRSRSVPPVGALPAPARHGRQLNASAPRQATEAKS